MAPSTCIFLSVCLFVILILFDCMLCSAIYANIYMQCLYVRSSIYMLLIHFSRILRISHRTVRVAPRHVNFDASICACGSWF
jgi:hypothetical protein